MKNFLDKDIKMGRQSKVSHEIPVDNEISLINQFQLNTTIFHKTDLNLCINLIFMCPDGRNRLIRTRSYTHIKKLAHELSISMKVSEQVKSLK